MGKLLRIMKLTLVLMLVIVCTLSAETYSQNAKLNLSMKDASIVEIFKEIERTSEYGFFFKNDQLNLDKRYSINLKNATIEEVLETVLGENGLKYKVVDKNIVITRNAVKAAAMQPTEVKGKVTDETGEPLPGVSVVVKGTTVGVTTDFDGNYTLALPADAEVLVFSFVGMKTQEIAIAGQSAINIKMLEDAIGMEEVVVVGFGVQKKVNLTGSVATVDKKVLEARPVSNVGQALQGAVSGLNFSVGNGGGELNNSLSINIRGAGTIGQGSSSSPLVLIDGMEGDMNTLNPQDIENISVLKDAAAASIYGSRAPFGVILITTKEGKSGKMVVNYNNNFRWSDPVLQPHMLDSESFAYYWNEAAANNGQGLPFKDETIQKIKDFKAGKLQYGTEPRDDGSKNWKMYTESFGNTNWFDEHYKSWAPSQEHNLSVRGGSEKVRYYLSSNYLDQDGLLTYGDDSFKRFTLNAKINAQVHKLVRLTYNGKFNRVIYDRSSYQSALFFHNIARRWPTLPVYDGNGYYLGGNEIAHLQNGRARDEKDEFSQQLQFIFTPAKGWNINAQLNYRTRTTFANSAYLPIYDHDTEGKLREKALQHVLWSPGASRVYESAYKQNFFNPNIFTEYEVNLDGGHYLKGMVGFQSELNKTRNLSAYRDDVITAELPTINTASGEDKVTGGGYAHWATAGFFGRINYNYKERYLLEVNGRYDGTSRFLKDERWNFFPSFSLGWNVAREEFWKDLSVSNFVSTFKLRGSWGKLGNQNTGNWYPFYVTMPIGTANGGWLLNGEKPNTASAPGLVSELLTWENVKSYNFGLDASMFNSRLTFVFDYFSRKTEDMVGPAPQLPSTLGTSVPRMNNADMESKGFELEISWRDQIGELKYGVKAILSDSRQKVTRYPNETGSLNQWYAGRYSGEIWGYKTHGLAKTDEEMSAWIAEHDQSQLGNKWAAGDIMYENLDDDPAITRGANTLSDHGDLTIIGNSTPRYNFGLDLDMTWRGFDFRAFFQGVAKRDVWVSGPYFWGANYNLWQSAGFTEHLDYFRPEGTDSPLGANVDSYYPRPLFGGGSKNTKTQSRYLQNGAYIRLKNIQLGYTLPSEFTKRFGVNKLRMYVSGENLMTITKMTDIFDPETTGGGWGNGKIYPLSKIVSCGVSLTF
ncbi:SusC/RagA family TonB-linked outer membrane protein [Puteibacter caeruleilacunae]|nr:SusC/RagA family TonB-linked outer membrane protein [Puteibacter caeruleilacunae]